MLRPRGGDFVYTQDEVSVMLEDMRAMKLIGVTGFVFGALDSTGALDEVVCKRLLQAARPALCTLHRAFDLAKDWRSALDQAITLGFKAVLTSGQAPTAIAGRDRLKKIKKEAGDQIHIMAGSGVNSNTLPTLLSDTGCRWFHGSASVPVETKSPRNRIAMGSMDTNVHRVTSKEEVRNMRDLIDSFFGSKPIITPYY
ncbi:copper homeostasis protein CutC family protein [Teladorsagia circumcincta]|uniref:Copper homeostasis protein cutC homolog n=1 Tax=Teladorsagia circumcincta TaxID=45464 RepID=A0A2G9UYS4_TELCI|nr:copper homeostasis protein CutC family protein [Teladorsagia circumcincta]